MKVRKGFVSNSSSSSFLLAYKGEDHDTLPDLQKALHFKSKTLQMHDSSPIVDAIIFNTYTSTKNPRMDRVDLERAESCYLSYVQPLTKEDLDIFTAQNKQVYKRYPEWAQTRDKPYDWHIERTLIENGFNVFYGSIPGGGDGGTAIENVAYGVSGYFASKNEVWLPYWEQEYAWECRLTDQAAARQYKNAELIIAEVTNDLPGQLKFDF